MNIEVDVLAKMVEQSMGALEERVSSLERALPSTSPALTSTSYELFGVRRGVSALWKRLSRGGCSDL